MVPREAPPDAVRLPGGPQGSNDRMLVSKRIRHDGLPATIHGATAGQATTRGRPFGPGGQGMSRTAVMASNGEVTLPMTRREDWRGRDAVGDLRPPSAWSRSMHSPRASAAGFAEQLEVSEDPVHRWTAWTSPPAHPSERPRTSGRPQLAARIGAANVAHTDGAEENE